MVSMAKPHYTNKGVKENRALSLNIVSEAMLPAASYVGKVSGAKVDKSDGRIRCPFADRISPDHGMQRGRYLRDGNL